VHQFVPEVRVGEQGLDRVHVHNLPGPQREASGMVHPPVHRDHRERSGETGDRDRDTGSEMGPRGKPMPLVNVNPDENGLGEE
jgi:hypothetical protein